MGPLFQKEAMIWSYIIKNIRLHLSDVSSQLIVYGETASVLSGSQPFTSTEGPFQLCCVTESEKSFCKQKCDAISDWLKTEFNIVLDAMFLTESEFQKRKELPIYKRVLDSGVDIKNLK